MIRVLCLFLAFWVSTATTQLTVGENQALTDLGVLGIYGFTGTPSCSWPGVTCNANGHVIAIQTSVSYDNTLPIPASIGNLIYLQELALTGEDGKVTGALPDSIGNLVNLVTLDISGNFYDGGLISLPSTLGSLINLKTLILNDNALSGTIPSEIFTLSSLTFLGLSGNFFSGTIPAGISNMVNLETLYLNGNDFSGTIPSSISNLVNLQSLGLNENSLTGQIPDSLGSLVQLELLYLDGNLLSGSIPSSLGNLKELTTLYLSGNLLSGSIPANLGTLNLIEYMHLEYNLLSGTIPADFLAETPHLFELMMNNNQFSGQIPSSIIGTRYDNRNMLPPITVLSHNQFSGPVPAVYNGARVIYTFDISFNSISGPVPSLQAGPQGYGETLSIILSNNQFTGSVPFNIGGQLFQYYSGVLDLSVNLLAGTIPVGVVTALSTPGVGLNFSHNSLIGSIPSDFESWPPTNLEPMNYFDLSWNQLSGSIPSTIGNAQLLNLLALDHNLLIGALPSSMVNLFPDFNLDNSRRSYPSVLDISVNQLSGPLTINPTNLEVLNVGSNQFSGVVANAVCSITSCYIGGNSLSCCGVASCCGIQCSCSTHSEADLSKTQESSSKRLSTGTIIGIVLAAVFLLVVVTIGVIIAIVLIRRRASRVEDTTTDRYASQSRVELK